MRIFKRIDQLPSFTNAIVTIGSYDGVHMGHRKIIDRVNQLAEANNGESVLITFDPHPRKLLQGEDSSLQLLSTLDEKIELLREAGLDNLIIIPFDMDFANQPPETYITDFLVKKFNPTVVVIGYDHRFGKDRAGDINLLKSMADKHHFKVVEIQKKEIEDIAISSTKTRKALNRGDVTLAKKYLNRPYCLTGTVVSGDKIGREMGFPTANIQVENEDKLIPAEGIYAAEVEIGDVSYQGMLYIGTRPTLNSVPERKIEVNIFDFNDDIYDEKITVRLLKRIREDARFFDLSALQTQLHKDKAHSLEYFDSVSSAEKPAEEKAMVTIAILNYNGLDYLEAYLPKTSYSSDRYDFKVVIIDNASSDDSLDYVREWHPEVEIIETGSNLGFSGGYNYGLQHIDTKYTVLLNSDVLITEGWIDPIIEAMESDGNIGAAQPKIRSLEDKNSFEYAGACGGFLDTLGYPYCRGRIFDEVEEDTGQYDQPIEIAWASGAAMVIRTALYKDMGGLDDDFFAHIEEIDLCCRMRRAGYKIKIIPSSVVYHLGGGTLDYNNPKKVFLNFRNALFLVLKNEKMPQVLWKLFIRLFLDGISSFRFFLQGNLRSAFQVLNSHVSFYLGLFKMIKKRLEINKVVEQHRIGPESKVPTVLSIVVNYFVKDIKRFSDLNRNYKC